MVLSISTVIPHQVWYPINQIFSPASVAPVLGASTSIVITAPSANDESEITAGVAALVEVFSVASIVILVESIVVPPSLISTVNPASVVGAVVKVALTSVNVKA